MEIATNKGLTDDIKHIASQAAVKMEKIEGWMQINQPKPSLPQLFQSSLTP